MAHKRRATWGGGGRSARAQWVCSTRRPSLSTAFHSDILIHLRERAHIKLHIQDVLFICVFVWRSHQPGDTIKGEKDIFSSSVGSTCRGYGPWEKRKTDNCGKREKYRQRGWLIQLHVLWMAEQLQGKCAGGHAWKRGKSGGGKVTLKQWWRPLPSFTARRALLALFPHSWAIKFKEHG